MEEMEQVAHKPSHTSTELGYVIDVERQKNGEGGLFSKWTPKEIIQIESVEIESPSFTDGQQCGIAFFFFNFLEQTNIGILYM